MEMILITVGIAVLLVSAFVMPWVNRNLIRHLQNEIKQLKRTIKQLVATLEKKEEAISPTQPTQYSPATTHKPAREQESAEQVDIEQTKTEPVTDAELRRKPVPRVGFEQQLGARLPVWIGGVALALAGFFLVKYSIENDLLSPIIRVALGGILGITLLYAAKWVRSKPDFANGVRIAQSLAGAGIAVLYVVAFASSRYYELVPMFAGFAAMAAVTVVALVLSLRHGPPIALLGMVGGFLTPTLFSTGGDSAFALFTYLYFIASGLLIVVRKTRWWWLSIPTVVAALLWVMVWLLFSYHPGDSLWLGLFLVGISAAIVIASKRQYEEEGGGTSAGIFKLTSILNYIGLGGALIIMGVIVGQAAFGLMEWELFGLLAVGGIGLAYFNDKLYGFVPWISMVVNAVMLSTWLVPDYASFTMTLAIFSFIYMGSGYFLMFRARLPVSWAGLIGVTGLSYYLIAYSRLHTTALFADIPLFWGAAALTLAVMSIYAIFKIKQRFSDDAHRDHLYAIFAVAATTFISLALYIELDREFLSVALATEMLAIAWINSKVSIRALRPIIVVLAGIFALLLWPQVMRIIRYSLLTPPGQYLQLSVPIVQWPLFQLGVPAAMFFGSAYLLRRQQDNRLIQILEGVAIALGAVMIYYFTRNSLNPDQNVLLIKAAFIERGIITNILFVYGLLCLWAGRRYRRVAFSWGGIALCTMAALRIIAFDLFLYNPLWEVQKIAGGAIFNSLLLPYGLPFVWAYFARKELVSFGRGKLAHYAGGFMLIVVFTLVSLNVRHLFHGEYLNVGKITYEAFIITHAEIYTYSVVWLLLGISLLFAGILKRDKMLRYASLGVILLTVGKVFLFDASELEGLYRVFSFFGLGISLIGLSYFYTRFVFREGRET